MLRFAQTTIGDIMKREIRLDYLYEAARLGTMRAASEELAIATSSISRQIAALEKDLGVRLIESGRRKIKLTEAGEAACAHYREARAHEESFLSRLQELKSTRIGNVDLAVGEAFITGQFNESLYQFMKNYPGMTVRVRMSGTNHTEALVHDDEVHFGLIFDVPRDQKVRARMSLQQPLRVIVHPAHELAGKTMVALADLAHCSIALPDESFRIRQIVHAAEQEEGVHLKLKLIANSMTVLKDFALAGGGVTLLPEFIVLEDLLAGRLRAISSTNSVLNATKISLITRAGRQIPIGAYRLMQRIENHLKTSMAHLVALPVSSH
jgi:DNA-binding transcriptional LysR family regulator